MAIIKDVLHSELHPNDDLYPKTDISQVDGLSEELIKMGEELTKLSDKTDLKLIYFPYGEFTGLTYDTNGLVMEGTARVTYDNGYYDMNMSIKVPIVAGDGVSIDMDETNHKLVIKSTAGGLKLYKHAITVTGGSNVGYFVIYTNFKENLTYNVYDGKYYFRLPPSSSLNKSPELFIGYGGPTSQAFFPCYIAIPTIGLPLFYVSYIDSNNTRKNIQPVGTGSWIEVVTEVVNY